MAEAPAPATPLVATSGKPSSMIVLRTEEGREEVFTIETQPYNYCFFLQDGNERPVFIIQVGIVKMATIVALHTVLPAGVHTQKRPKDSLCLLCLRWDILFLFNTRIFVLQWHRRASPNIHSSPSPIHLHSRSRSRCALLVFHVHIFCW